jgi:hypothetical protein
MSNKTHQCDLLLNMLWMFSLEGAKTSGKHWHGISGVDFGGGTGWSRRTSRDEG